MKSENPGKKLIVERQMEAFGNFHKGGTVTGRFLGLSVETQEIDRTRRWADVNPNPQTADRQIGKKVVHGLVQIDFRDMERRIMSALVQKIAEDVISNAFSGLFATIQARIDDEGCGAVVAALRGPCDA